MDQARLPPPIAIDSWKPKDGDGRSKKGEWSNLAIHFLLDAYEATWNKRSRGNLRVGDWEEVAAHVSSRCDDAKTPSQCKNKIEGMKKKYRFEAMEACISRTGFSGWPFFSRMDLLLRCPARVAGIPGGLDAGAQPGLHDAVLETESTDSDRPAFGSDADFSPRAGMDFSHLQLLQADQDLQQWRSLPHEQKDVQQADSKHDDCSNTLPPAKDCILPNSETSAPGGKVPHTPCATRKPNAGKKKRIHDEVAASIKTFADSILKLEQAKMEMYKDTVRLRAEAETRRADLELKRTDIIMNTQLQMAKLLSGNNRKRRKASTFPSQNVASGVDAALLQIVAKNMQAFGYAGAMDFPQSSSANKF